MRRLLLALLVAACIPACQSSKKDDVIITVHSQGTDMDSPKTIFRRPIGNRTMIFKIIPEFSTQSVSAIHTFPADDGTYALKLDFKGRQSLDMVTRLRRGEILMTMVNGVVVDHVQIDRPVADGLFTVWRGIPAELVTKMEEKYASINTLESSSTFLEMDPSTKKEKKDARRKSAEAARQKKEDEKRKLRGDFEPESPDGDVVPLSELLKTSR
jgi:hypothetical protein